MCTVIGYDRVSVPAGDATVCDALSAANPVVRSADPCARHVPAGV
jgi:hypothetical protein